MTTLTMPQPSFVPTKRREESAMSDFVEQKVFTSEVKRLDSEIFNIKKAEEKQDKTTFEAIKSLREDMKELRDEMKELRDDMKELRGDMNRRFEHFESSFRWLVGMYITGTGVMLAAFYAFASYIKG